MYPHTKFGNKVSKNIGQIFSRTEGRSQGHSDQEAVWDTLGQKMYPKTKGLGSRRGEIGPAIEMHTNLKYVYMVYIIKKNRNFICLVLKLCKLWVSKDKGPL